MDAKLLTREIAERYLDELIEAERTHDYALCCKRWRNDFSEDFSEERFAEEVKDTQDCLGEYKGREYIGCEIEDESPADYRKRYVWKTIWEKQPCVIIVGLHEAKGVVYLNEWMYHYGEENLCMFLLNTDPDASPGIEAPHSLGKPAAELVLDEILEAEKTSNYELWSKRWKAEQAVEYNNEEFLTNIKSSLENIGHYVSREYIGNLSYVGENGKTYNYIWKCQYEKEPAITNLGIYEKDGVVYLDEIWTSWGDDHVYMWLLNHKP